MSLRTAIITVFLLSGVEISAFSALSGTHSSAGAYLEPFLIISSSKTEFSPEENVYLEMKISTKSKTPLYILVPDPNGHLCRIILTNLDKGSTEVVKYPAGPWKRISYKPFLISRTLPFRARINASKLMPGRYSIQVRYDSPPAFAISGVWTGSVFSNKIDILVTELLADKIDKDRPARLGISHAKWSFIKKMNYEFPHLSLDRNGDGLPDIWHDTARQIIIRDSDFNGIPDVWEYYKNNRIFRSGYDTDGDGLPDTFNNE